MRRDDQFWSKVIKAIWIAGAFVLLSNGGITEWTVLSQAIINLHPRSQALSLGHEVSVPIHLRDEEEFTFPIRELLAHGKSLFSANWTEQEGGGRPLTK